jgi:ABC-type lipoprotein release transport system permease subunit
MIDDPYQLNHAMKTLKSKVHPPYSVMSWSEMNPEILQMIEGDRSGAIVMKGILYLLVGFGIFGTIMMMIMERRREMGVLVAIGMQKSKLAVILLYETVLIGIIGVLTGFAGSIPVIAYLYNHPVELTGNVADTMVQMGIEPYMYFSWLPSIFYNQVITVFAMIIIIAVYPVTKAFTMKVHEDLRA